MTAPLFLIFLNLHLTRSRYDSAKKYFKICDFIFNRFEPSLKVSLFLAVAFNSSTKVLTANSISLTINHLALEPFLRECKRLACLPTTLCAAFFV